MNSSEIDHNGFHLHYYPSGNGEKKLLVFHGYGQKSDDWHHYLKAFETSYTIYYFELFGHGRSLVEKEAEKKGILAKITPASLSKANESSSIVDAALEKKRISENIKKGEDITTGQTPTLDSSDAERSFLDRILGR